MRRQADRFNERLLPFAMKLPVDRDVKLYSSLPNRRSSLLSLELQEQHHRMRNSLHLIASDLLLRSRRTANVEAREALAAAARQLDSVCRTHEYLYQNSLNINQLAREYISALLKDLTVALLGNESPRKLTLIPGHEFGLNGDLLVTLGAIVVELVTNAVKYAVGNVQISLERHAGRLEVRVEDEGTGFPAGFNLGDTGFGFRLVRRLCSDYEGLLFINTNLAYGSVVAVLVG